MNEVAAVLEGVDLDDLLATLMTMHGGTAILPMSLLGGWIIGRVIHFSRVSRNELPMPDSADIDLLQLDNLYAVGRSGLRRALVSLLGIAIGGLILLDTEFGLWGSVPLFGFGLVAGLTLLLRPAREVRSLIRAVKLEDLTRLEPLLRQARDDALSGDGAQGRLTDLMAYRDRVVSTAEWPFDTPTITRFGLYLLIPVGSMVGGALVERVVDTLLG